MQPQFPWDPLRKDRNGRRLLRAVFLRGGGRGQQEVAGGLRVLPSPLLLRFAPVI